jgi:hypothetical protein
LYRQEYPLAVERQIRDEAARSGEKLPDKIANAPQLEAGLSMYYNAWFELDQDRDTGHSGLKRIPRSEIIAYAYDCSYDPVQTDNLLVFVRLMDNAYLAYIRSKMPKPKGGAGVAGPGPQRRRGR